MEVIRLVPGHGITAGGQKKRGKTLTCIERDVAALTEGLIELSRLRVTLTLGARTRGDREIEDAAWGALRRLNRELERRATFGERLARWWARCGWNAG